jgi:RNA polymerase sigma-70 factor (ECF subfamily)
MSSTSSNATRLSLLRRIQGSEDSQAWNDMVSLYSPLVAYWCRQYGLDRESIRDCVQEVFFSVLKSISDFTPSKSRGSFRGWLWTIARHKIIDAQRRSRHSAPAAGGSTAIAMIHQLPTLDAPSEVEQTNDLQLNLLMHRALLQVKAEFEEKTWQAFWRTTVDCIPTAVVASELGLSTASVRKYRSRVLHRLREQLGDPC